MTSAQAKQYRFLQDRISVHLESGNNSRALRIANVLTTAVHSPPPAVVPVPAHAPPASAAPSLPGHEHDDAPVAPSGPALDHARLRFDIFFQAAEAQRSADHLNIAQRHFEEALNISKTDADQIETIEIAHLNHNFASLHDQLGDEATAEIHYQAALDILEVLDPQPKEQIANIANNLAMISRNSGNLEIGEQRYLKALEIFEELRGAEHLDVAVVCNNLGSLYWAWRQPEKARDRHLQALAIRRKNLPDDDPDVGQSACNLAAVYHDLNDFDKASRNYQRGLKILRHNLAEDPESYEVVAQNYAELLRENGHQKKADNLLGKVARQLKSKAKAKAKAEAKAGSSSGAGS